MSATTASTFPAALPATTTRDVAGRVALQGRLVGARLPLVAIGMSLVASGAFLLVAALFLPRHGQLVTLGGLVQGHFSLLDELTNWDAAWYRDIAEHGYSWVATSPAQQNVAFYPLFPLVEVAGHAVTRLPYAVVGVAASIVFQAGAAAVLALAVRRCGGSDAAALLWAGLFVISPPAVFDVMGYFEALLCLLLFLAFSFVEQDRRWAAAACLGLATATHGVGVVCAGAFALWLVIGAVRAHETSPARIGALIAQVALAFSGVAAFAAYLGARFGDPLAFYQANRAWLSVQPLTQVVKSVAELAALRHAVVSWAASPYGPQSFSFVVDSIAAVLILTVIVALAARRGGLASFAFWAVVAGFLLAQSYSADYGNEASTTRFVLPLVFAAGATTAGTPLRRALTRPAVLPVVVALLVVCTVFFLQRLATGQWID